MDITTKYAELDENNIANRTQLLYFIERYHITPVKAQRLDVLLGELLIEQSNGVPCFKCDGKLNYANIVVQAEKYNHVECPKSAYRPIVSQSTVKVDKYFQKLGG